MAKVGWADGFTRPLGTESGTAPGPFSPKMEPSSPESQVMFPKPPPPPRTHCQQQQMGHCSYRHCTADSAGLPPVLPAAQRDRPVAATCLCWCLLALLHPSPRAFILSFHPTSAPL